MISMKKKSKKLKPYIRLKGRHIVSTFNELDLLEPRPNKQLKSLLHQIYNYLPSGSSK